MKHLTALLTMAITLTGLAQQMPYNPDANGDDFVGVDDVLGVLGVYDALMQPNLQCDYEGTDLEEFIGGVFRGLWFWTLSTSSTYSWTQSRPISRGAQTQSISTLSWKDLT